MKIPSIIQSFKKTFWEKEKLQLNCSKSFRVEFFLFLSFFEGATVSCSWLTYNERNGHLSNSALAAAAIVSKPRPTQLFLQREAFGFWLLTFDEPEREPGASRAFQLSELWGRLNKEKQLDSVRILPKFACLEPLLYALYKKQPRFKLFNGYLRLLPGFQSPRDTIFTGIPGLLKWQHS